MRRFILLGGIGAALVGVTNWQKKPSPEGPAYQKLPQTPYEHHPNKHLLTKIPSSIGIIGGGSAGLTTAKILRQQGFQVEILEKGSRVGGVWAENYDGAGLQGAYPHFNMPDHEFPQGTPSFPKLDLVQAFFDTYIEKFNLMPLVSLNSEVTNVAQSPEGEWTVTLAGGATKKYDFLVLCTGMFFKPHMPALPGLASFRGKALHSSHFRNAKELCAGKKVVVVGAGKSALDIMNVACDNAETVTGLIRKHVWSVPMEQTLFGYPIRTFLKNRLSEFLTPSPEEPHTWLTSLLKPFADLYWNTVCTHMKEGLPSSMMPQTDMRIQRCNMVLTRDPVVFGKIDKGEIKIVTGEIEAIVPEGLVVGGRTVPADLIVFATGFEKTTLGITEGDMWLYRGVLLPHIKNFAAVGYGVGVYSQLRNNLQATWLAEMIRGKVVLPPVKSMQSAVAARKEVLLQAYREFPTTAPYAWLEVGYFDTLMRDMGLETRRKPSLLAELMDSPDPLDYKTVLTHRV